MLPSRVLDSLPGFGFFYERKREREECLLPSPVLMMCLLRFKAALWVQSANVWGVGANPCAEGESQDPSGVYGSPGPVRIPTDAGAPPPPPSAVSLHRPAAGRL